MARILQLVRDDNDRLAWAEVGSVDEDRSPEVALSAWFDEQGEDLLEAEYVAVCADGRRTASTRPGRLVGCADRGSPASAAASRHATVTRGGRG